MRHSKIDYACMRHFKVFQEKKANQDCEYARAKRSPASLPDPWDDYWIRSRKTWKDKRKTQYRESRGQKRCIKLPSLFYQWGVERYFKLHDIPYRIESLREPHTYYCPWRERWVKTYRVVGYQLTWWSDKDIGIDYILRSTQSANFEGYEVLT